MATREKILQLRIERARQRKAQGKASRGELRLLARVEKQEARQRERKEVRGAFERAIAG